MLNEQTAIFTTSRKANAFLVLVAFMLTNVFAVNVIAQTSGRQVAESLLTKYATDVTELARSKKITPSVNFEREVDRLAEAVIAGGQRQPVLIDSVGKDQFW